MASWSARFAVLAAVGWIGCGGGAPAARPEDPQPLPDHVLVSELRVELSESLAASRRELLERVEVPSLVRLAALDWFEHEGRFASTGQVRLRVEVSPGPEPQFIGTRPLFIGSLG